MGKKILLMVLSAIFLFSCATSENYGKKLQNWVGRPAGELEAEWGRPAHTKIFANGDSIITYIKANGVYVPSEYIIFNEGYVPGDDITIQPYPGASSNFMNTEELVGYEAEYTCQTSFLVQNGIITGWRWSGNNCVAY